MAAKDCSPWLGRMGTFDECERAGLIPGTMSPEPTEDLFLAGYCGVCRRDTRFRLPKTMFHGRWGYLYREALTCQHCHFNARMRAALQYVFELGLPSRSSVYITEKVTPLYSYLQSRLFPDVIGSEFLPGVPLGAEKGGIRCEDVQNLTFPSAVFDLIICLDVLEHVPFYRKALAEMRRVLKRGGRLVMTAPFTMQRRETFPQARLTERGEIEHLIPEPEYHGNPLGPPSLSYNTFGWSLLNDMCAEGFARAHVIPYWNGELGYVGGPFPLIVGEAGA